LETISSDSYSVLESISEFIGLLPLTIGLIKFRDLHRNLYPILVLVLIGLLTDLINHKLAVENKNNAFVFHLYTLLEFSFVILFYYCFYDRKSILLLIPLFLAIGLIDYKFNGLSHFDNYATGSEAIIISTLSLWSFYYIISNMVFQNLMSESFFWMNCAILFYFGGNMILFVFSDYILEKEDIQHMALWGIHSVLNIIYNIVLAIGFWKTRRP
jgi:hypothetical protein